VAVLKSQVNFCKTQYFNNSLALLYLSGIFNKIQTGGFSRGETTRQSHE